MRAPAARKILKLSADPTRIAQLHLIAPASATADGAAAGSGFAGKIDVVDQGVAQGIAIRSHRRIGQQSALQGFTVAQPASAGSNAAARKRAIFLFMIALIVAPAP